MLAVNTYLGWTLLSRVPCKKSLSHTMTTTSLIAKDMPISTLWYHDVLGIENPEKRRTKAERELATLEHFKQAVKRKQSKTRVNLSAIEVDEAEVLVIRFIQKESFQDSKYGPVKSLNLFVHAKDVLRLKIRILEREDVSDFKYPALLPSDHPVVTRLIHETHVKANHVGVQGEGEVLARTPGHSVPLVERLFLTLSGRKASDADTGRLALKE
uniref:Uncharacterized protein n=1 Tax=Timema douglasi TaxID=61478 RepID=A0A7R8Z3V0_TIMDO|nr:unnamed protein product [Timema douglasi]